jgi:hypothetical protein
MLYQVIGSLRTGTILYSCFQGLVCLLNNLMEELRLNPYCVLIDFKVMTHLAVASVSFLVAVLEFELMAFYLLGKHSTT